MKFFIYELGENLNNIFSTESLSPSSFYKNRNFGYKFLDGQNFLRQDNFILLFSEPVSPVDSNDINYDSFHFPVIIEIERDENDLDLVDITSKCTAVPDQIKVFACTKTIYFSALKDKFYLKEDCIFYARNNTLKSLETKMFDFYDKHNCFLPLSELRRVINHINQNEFLLNFFSDTTKSSNEVIYDRSFDRLKGATFGYVFGLAASISPELLELIRKYQAFSNYIALSLNQKELSPALKPLSCELQSVFSKELSNSIELLISKINEYCNKQKPSQKELAKFNDEISYVHQHIEKEYNLFISSKRREKEVLENSRMPTIDNENVMLPYLDGASLNYDRKVINNVLNLILKEKDVFYVEGIEGKKRFIKSIASDVIIPLYSKNIWSITKEIAKAFKIDSFRLSDDLIINQLLQNIANNSSFDIEKLNLKKDLKALCVSVMYMNKDLLSFQSKLISMNLTDFSVPLCLWGAIFGFSAFDRRITDLFFNSKEDNAVNNIYRNLLHCGKVISSFECIRDWYYKDDFVFQDILSELFNSLKYIPQKLNEKILSIEKKNYECNQMGVRNNRKKESQQSNFDENNSSVPLNKKLPCDEKAFSECKQPVVETPFQVNSEKASDESFSVEKAWKEFVDSIDIDVNGEKSVFSSEFDKLTIKQHKDSKLKNLNKKDKEKLKHELSKILKKTSYQDIHDAIKNSFDEYHLEKNNCIEDFVYFLLKLSSCFNKEKYHCLYDQFTNDIKFTLH